jgi:rRNA maturation endonuclease Nob1
MARTRNLGFAETYDLFGNVVVTEKLTCNHCQKIFNKPGPNDPVGFCHQCFAPVCLACGAIDRCDPFEKKLERLEQRARLLKAAGT